MAKAASVLIVTGFADRSSATVGSKETVTAVASGGSGSYKYTFVIMNKSTGKSATLSSSQTSNVYAWSSGLSGVKTLKVTVTDSNGATATAGVDITVG